MSPDPRPMNPRPHSRNGSNGRKGPPAHAAGAGRPSTTKQPPPLTRRGKSYDNQHSHAGAHHHHHKSSTSLSSKRASHDGAVAEDSEGEPGMASFLQFCTTCERQIVTPGTNILYCSENCRRKDIGMPTPLSPMTLTPLTPSTTSYFDHYPAPDIVPQRSPTMPRHPSMSFSEFALAESRRTSEISYAEVPTKDNNTSSDAARYLAQFCTETAGMNARRHMANRISVAALESTLPSLVHSPSSSYGTVASNASYRPLPPRQNPFTSTFSTKSIDLVIPCQQQQQQPPAPTESFSRKDSLTTPSSMKSSASTMTSFRVAEANDLSYGGRRSSSRKTSDATLAG